MRKTLAKKKKNDGRSVRSGNNAAKSPERKKNRSADLGKEGRDRFNYTFGPW